VNEVAEDESDACMSIWHLSYNAGKAIRLGVF
jgi:hypothetical protein